MEGFQDQLTFIEDLIFDEGSLQQVFRLLCLHSLVNGGVQKQQLEVLQRAVLHSYGHRQALTFAALERCGLLRVHDGIWPQAGAWQRLSHDFRVNTDDSEGIGRATNGRVPLSIRIIESAVESVVQEDTNVGMGVAERRLALAARTGGPAGWRARREAINLVGPASSIRRRADRPRAADDPRQVLVVFLGGVTYGELAALRRLEASEGCQRKFLVATTELLAARRLLASMGCEEPTVPDNSHPEPFAAPTFSGASAGESDARSRASTVESAVRSRAATSEPSATDAATGSVSLDGSIFSRFGIR